MVGMLIRRFIFIFVLILYVLASTLEYNTMQADYVISDTSGEGGYMVVPVTTTKRGD